MNRVRQWQIVRNLFFNENTNHKQEGTVIFQDWNAFHYFELVAIFRLINIHREKFNSEKLEGIQCYGIREWRSIIDPQLW